MQKNSKTIPLLGENTSQPDLVVPDGACEEIINMRFRNNSWQSVGHIAASDESGSFTNDIATISGLNIRFLGKHEVEGEEHLFYCYHNKKIGIIVSVYSQGESSILLTIPSKSDVENVTFTTFGDIAIISYNKQSYYFIYRKGKYTAFSMPAPVEVREKRVNIDYPNYSSDDANLQYVKLMDYDSKEILVTTSKDNGWVGEVCYLVAYKMTDGTIIAPSNLRIFCTEEKDLNATDIRIMRIPHYVNGVLSDSAYSLVSDRGNLSIDAKHLAWSYPKLLIHIPEGIDTSIIDRVCIFSTRINSFIDFEKLSKTVLSPAKDAQSAFNQSKDFLQNFYADNELPNQPLYLVAEKNIDSIGENGWEIALTYPSMKALTTESSEYSAPQLHKIHAEAMYDYNQRLHFANITSELYSHQSSLVPTFTQDGFFQEGVRFDELGKLVFSQPIKQPTNRGEAVDLNYPINAPSQNYSLAMGSPILSYPDYRATSLFAFHNNSEEADAMPSIPLRSAPANNFAYYIVPSEVDLKYPSKEFEVPRTIQEPFVEDKILSEPNRLQVSAPNNPFSFPFDNSYKVGNEGTKIVAINSVADTLVESNFFGSYPLYIFTSDGIFALSAGSGKILYGSTEIINHDISTNANTIAINGAVVFATSEGIKAISGRSTALLSADIENPTGYTDKWSKATFAISRLYNELLVANEDSMHIYNLNSKVWSKRSLPSNSTISLRGDYLAVESTSKLSLFAINNEQTPSESSPLDIYIVTRPIKLDSQGFKGLATLVARWKSELPSLVSITIECSKDCVNWGTLSRGTFTTQSQIGLRSRPVSARYFRIKINATTVSHSTLLSLDASFVNKFNNKLR